MRNNEVLAFRLATKAFQKLDNLLKEKWGHGGIRRLEQELGYEDGWWKSHRRPRSYISLTNLFAVLRKLGEHPGEFFEDLLLDEPWETSKSALAVTFQQLPPLAQRALQAFDRTPVGDVTEDGDLAQLDQRRYEDPLGVLNLLHADIETIPRQQIPMALAIGGSSYRVVYAIPEATACLQTALNMAQNRLEKAEVLKRLGLVYATSQPKKGLQKIGQARQEFAYHCEIPKVGETVLDEAVCHYSMGDFRAAIETYHNGLKYSEHLSHHYRLAAFQGLAMCHYRVEEQRTGCSWLHHADQELRYFDRYSIFRAHYLWAKGLLLEDSRDLEDAIETLSSTRHPHYFEAMTCCLELCHLLHRQNRTLEAIDAARSGAALAQASSSSALIRVFEDLIAAIQLDRKFDFSQQKGTVEQSRRRYVRRRLRKAMS